MGVAVGLAVGVAEGVAVGLAVVSCVEAVWLVIAWGVAILAAVPHHSACARTQWKHRPVALHIAQWPCMFQMPSAPHWLHLGTSGAGLTGVGCAVLAGVGRLCCMAVAGVAVVGDVVVLVVSVVAVVAAGAVVVAFGVAVVLAGWPWGAGTWAPR